MRAKKGARKKIFRGNKSRVTKHKHKLSLKVIGQKLAKLTKTIETKSGVRTISDGTEYLHNNLYTISSDFLTSNNGTVDTEMTTGSRIGDQISLIGVKFTMMLELNERYSDVTFRLMVIKSAKGDYPGTGTMWQGEA